MQNKINTSFIKFCKDYKWFILPYLVFLGIMLPLLSVFPKDKLHIIINFYHAPFFDVFFHYLTWLGDGLFIVSVVILLLFLSFRKAFMVGITYAASGLFVQLLKNFVFTGCVRPVKYFAGKYALHLVDGVTMFNDHSFPSGHSASAFGLFLCIAFLSRNSTLSFFMFLAALLVAFSRVYLSQHFLGDIVAGSLVGSLSGVFFGYYFQKLNNQWLDGSLITIYNRNK
jgi:membrane-associated phospholipid phosphatase